MKITVQIAELKVYDPELYRDLAEMIAEKGLSIDNMREIFIESEAGYVEEAMKRLQARAVEALQLIEEERRKPQSVEPVAQEPVVQEPRTFADKLLQHSS